MKAILEFNLDEFDDEIAHNRCVKALDMALILWELQYNTKRDIEREFETNKCDRYEALDLIFKRFYDLLEEHNVNPDKLII